MKKQISLYIHIPYCLSKCSYCDFFSKPCTPDEKGFVIPDEYINALCRELEYRLNKCGDCEIKTIYIGGGTPSLLKPQQISKLSSAIFNHEINSKVEFTFELNPDDVTQPLLESLVQNKVTRISLGVQSFSDTVLKSVQRRADSKVIRAAMELIQQSWPGKLSVDLICGLPGETEESMLCGIKTLVDLRVPHISFYSLCVEEETPLGKKILEGAVPYSQDNCDELWLKGRDFLLQNGYEQYEISNFCLSGNECLHNMTYWTHSDYIGIGSGAAGTVYEKDGTGLRTVNLKDVQQYIVFWSSGGTVLEEKIPQETEKLSVQTSEFEFFMMGLRTNRGVSTGSYRRIFGKNMSESIIKKFEEWNKKGWCKSFVPDGDPQDCIYVLTQDGMLFLNRLLEELLP